MTPSEAKFTIGQVARHCVYDLRGVVFDVDPTFSEDEGWSAVTFDARICKDQPFYYLLAECGENSFVAYIPEQNLVADVSGEPVQHPQIGDLFDLDDNGAYHFRNRKFQ
jgi:heat shock protein HspQ